MIQQNVLKVNKKVIDKRLIETYNVLIENTKGERYMSEKEEKIIETIAEALPHMPEFDKGYLLGKAEGMAAQKEHKDVLPRAAAG